MTDLNQLALVADRCRFASAATIRRLLPGIESEIPLIFKLGSAEQEIIGDGFPVVPNTKLEVDLHDLLYREIELHLESPHYREDLLSPEAEDRIRGEAYVKLLADLLVKAVSAGSLFKFENVIWLLLSERVATAFQTHPKLAPLSLKDPERAARIKREVLASVTTRNRVANASLEDVFRRTAETEWNDRVYTNPLNEALNENRLIYTERADSLYAVGNHPNAFLVKDYRLPQKSFARIFELVSAALKQEMTDLDRGQLNPRNLFLQEEFLRGVALESAEAGVSALAHRDDVVQYVLYHLEPREFPRDLRRDVEDPERLRDLVHAYVEVLNDLVIWDFFNTLRGLIREVEIRQGKAWYGETVLSAKTIPITLDRGNIYNHNRWGTYVLFDIIGFSKRTREMIGAYVGLAIQNLFAIRRDRLAEFHGRPEAFEGDAVFESFDRALDAIRYISVFKDHYEEQQTIKRRYHDRPTQSPFQEGFRVGIGTGESYLISVYQGDAFDGTPREEFKRIGQVINLTSRLSTGKAGEAFFSKPELQDEPDPLGIFQATVDHDGNLTSSGIVALDSTFDELVQQVQAEGLKHVLEATPGGARSPFRHYGFALIYIDSVIDRIVLVRQIRNKPLFKGFENAQIRCYELLIVKGDEYRDLRRRDLELSTAGRDRPAPPAPATAMLDREAPPDAETVRIVAPFVKDPAGDDPHR